MCKLITHALVHTPASLWSFSAALTGAASVFLGWPQTQTGPLNPLVYFEGCHYLVQARLYWRPELAVCRQDPQNILGHGKKNQWFPSLHAPNWSENRRKVLFMTSLLALTKLFTKVRHHNPLCRQVRPLMDLPCEFTANCLLLYISDYRLVAQIQLTWMKIIQKGIKNQM